MNYFDLFEIPVQLKVNTALISKKFFELSRSFHPDYFTNENETVQSTSLENSALLNNAWKTFQNPDETIKYVLQLRGLLEEEEKYVLPPDFLMEVMEINEEMMDTEETVNPGLQTRITELQTEIFEPVKEIVENYNNDSITEKELLQVKEYYYKKKYLDRISRELTGMA